MHALLSTLPAHSWQPYASTALLSSSTAHPLLGSNDGREDRTRQEEGMAAPAVSKDHRNQGCEHHDDACAHASSLCERVVHAVCTSRGQLLAVFPSTRSSHCGLHLDYTVKASHQCLALVPRVLIKLQC